MDEAGAGRGGFIADGIAVRDEAGAGVRAEFRDDANREAGRGRELAAECARTGNAINVSPIPADYLRIGSGLGEAAPASIRLWPLPGIDRVAGVIELASFRPLDEAAEELLNEAEHLTGLALEAPSSEIGRAPCRERVCQNV